VHSTAQTPFPSEIVIPPSVRTARWTRRVVERTERIAQADLVIPLQRSGSLAYHVFRGCAEELGIALPPAVELLIGREISYDFEARHDTPLNDYDHWVGEKTPLPLRLQDNEALARYYAWLARAARRRSSPVWRAIQRLKEEAEDLGPVGEVMIVDESVYQGPTLYMTAPYVVQRALPGARIRALELCDATMLGEIVRANFPEAGPRNELPGPEASLLETLLKGAIDYRGRLEPLDEQTLLRVGARYGGKGARNPARTLAARYGLANLLTLHERTVHALHALGRGIAAGARDGTTMPAHLADLPWAQEVWRRSAEAGWPVGKVPLVNAHTHMRGEYWSHFNLMEIMEDCQFQAICVACTSATRPERLPSNALALLMKAKQPQRVYWFPGLHYDMPEVGYVAPPVAEQMAGLAVLGADGIKLIEGKPTAYRQIGLPLNGAHFEPVYEACESAGLPILMHVADPEELWDREQLPAWARERDWFYGDGTFPSKEQLYAEVERILERHPRLKLVLAHFYFLSGDMGRAAAFLDRWPSASFDITPGGEMYTRFSQAPGAWREFFNTYAGRILFGTDSWGGVQYPDREGWARVRQQVIEMRRFLETEDTFEGLGRGTLRGLGLPAETLAPLYAGNFYRLAGPRPHALDVSLAAQAAEALYQQLDGAAEALSEPRKQVALIRDQLVRIAESGNPARV